MDVKCLTSLNQVLYQNQFSDNTVEIYNRWSHQTAFPQQYRLSKEEIVEILQYISQAKKINKTLLSDLAQ